MVERKKGRHLFLPPKKKLDIIFQEINAKKQTKEMASMGDDQEENIEMWKIKKVRRRGLLRGFLFSLVFFLFFSFSLSLVMVLFDDDDDDVFLKAPR